MFERLKSALTPWLMWFSTFSLPARFLIGAAVSAIGSAGAVGVITKLGAYWFVLYYGIRTPADGLPYVAETAALLSVIVLLGAAAAYASATAMLKIAEHYVIVRRRGRLQSLFALIAWTLGLFSVSKAILRVEFPGNWKIVESLVISAAVCGMYTMWIARDVGPAKGALLATLVVVAASFLLWLPPTYGWFLRTIGHGGGRYCTVHLGGEPFPRQIKGYLVVRTGTALLMFDGKEETIEIPLEHVLRIEQPTKVYWCLPGNCTPTNTAPSRP